MKTALYARVSTDDKNQDPETQLLAVREFCERAGWEIVQEYVDRARAKDYAKRRSWQQLLKDGRMRKFQVVLVFRLDRAFRSVRECLNCLQDWQDRGISFRSLQQESIDTTTGQGRFVLQIMAAVAELESSIISDRVAAGMHRAAMQGKKLGRKRLGIASETIFDTLSRHGYVVSRVASALGCSRGYIYGVLKDNDLTLDDLKCQKR